MFLNPKSWLWYNSYLLFTGDTLAVVYKGNSYNFRLDQRTKESKDSHIQGRI